MPTGTHGRRDTPVTAHDRAHTTCSARPRRRMVANRFGDTAEPNRARHARANSAAVNPSTLPSRPSAKSASRPSTNSASAGKQAGARTIGALGMTNSVAAITAIASRGMSMSPRRFAQGLHLLAHPFGVGRKRPRLRERRAGDARLVIPRLIPPPDPDPLAYRLDLRTAAQPSRPSGQHHTGTVRALLPWQAGCPDVRLLPAA